MSTSDKYSALWAAWAEHGVGPETSLQVDHFFYAKSEAAARSLATALESEGMVVEVRSQRRHLIFRLWSIQGTRRLSGWNEATLREREAALDALAARHAVEYDGCGAAMP